MLSYAHGTASRPLLGETIGENLRRTCRAFPDRDAVVVRSRLAVFAEAFNLLGTGNEVWGPAFRTPTAVQPLRGLRPSASGSTSDHRGSPRRWRGDPRLPRLLPAPAG
jgi:hypothetical protein